jgi:multicomponent Na+:H+ antiporter subunit B
MGYGLFLMDYVMTGSNALPGHVPLGIPGHIISAGIIMPIDLLVGFEVTCTIYAFYALFSEGEL